MSDPARIELLERLLFRVRRRRGDRAWAPAPEGAVVLELQSSVPHDTSPSADEEVVAEPAESLPHDTSPSADGEVVAELGGSLPHGTSPSADDEVVGGVETLVAHATAPPAHGMAVAELELETREAPQSFDSLPDFGTEPPSFDDVPLAEEEEARAGSARAIAIPPPPAVPYLGELLRAREASSDDTEHDPLVDDEPTPQPYGPRSNVRGSTDERDDDLPTVPPPSYRGATLVPPAATLDGEPRIEDAELLAPLSDAFAEARRRSATPELIDFVPPQVPPALASRVVARETASELSSRQTTQLSIEVDAELIAEVGASPSAQAENFGKIFAEALRLVLRR